MIYYDTILSCCWAYLLTLQDQLALGFRMIQNAYNSKVQEPGESTTTGFLLKSPGFHVGSFPIPVFHVGFVGFQFLTISQTVTYSLTHCFFAVF